MGRFGDDNIPNEQIAMMVGLGGVANPDMVLQGEYIGSMKVKTSITLSEDLLKAIDQRSGLRRNRSEFIENALWTCIAGMVRDEQDARDLEIINRCADHLNQEAADVLAYQVAL